MKKIILGFLSLIIISMFLLGCSGEDLTGEAYRHKANNANAFLKALSEESGLSISDSIKMISRSNLDLIDTIGANVRSEDFKRTVNNNLAAIQRVANGKGSKRDVATFNSAVGEIDIKNIDKQILLIMIGDKIAANHLNLKRDAITGLTKFLSADILASLDAESYGIGESTPGVSGFNFGSLQSCIESAMESMEGGPAEGTGTAGMDQDWVTDPVNSESGTSSFTEDDLKACLEEVDQGMIGDGVSTEGTGQDEDMVDGKPAKPYEGEVNDAETKGENKEDFYFETEYQNEKDETIKTTHKISDIGGSTEHYKDEWTRTNSDTQEFEQGSTPMSDGEADELVNSVLNAQSSFDPMNGPGNAGICPDNLMAAIIGCMKNSANDPCAEATNPGKPSVSYGDGSIPTACLDQGEALDKGEFFKQELIINWGDTYMGTKLVPNNVDSQDDWK
jgi:hypothetical protein